MPCFFRLATWFSHGLFSLLEYTTNLVSDSRFHGLFPGATSRLIHKPTPKEDTDNSEKNKEILDRRQLTGYL